MSSNIDFLPPCDIRSAEPAIRTKQLAQDDGDRVGQSMIPHLRSDLKRPFSCAPIHFGVEGGGKPVAGNEMLKGIEEFGTSI
jgi:hypothetical protein